MIDYSKNELYCFNLVLGGRKIPGIHLNYPKILDKKKFNRECLEELKQKGLMDDDEKFTDEAMLKLDIVKSYKDLGNYVMINRLAVGIGTNNKLILVGSKDNETLQFDFTNVKLLLEGLFGQYPFLGKEDMGKSNRPNILSKEQFEKRLDSVSIDDMLYFVKVENNEPIDKFVIYQLNDKIYEYSYSSLIEREYQPKEARMRIFRLFVKNLDNEIGGEANGR